MLDLRDLKGDEKKEWQKAIKKQHSWTSFKDLVENEPTMIPEKEWEDYAWDMANDCLGIDLEKGSLSCYFDNEKWADDLKMDYTEIEVDGEIYYFHSY